MSFRQTPKEFPLRDHTAMRNHDLTAMGSLDQPTRSEFRRGGVEAYFCERL